MGKSVLSPGAPQQLQRFIVLRSARFAEPVVLPEAELLCYAQAHSLMMRKMKEDMDTADQNLQLVS